MNQNVELGVSQHIFKSQLHIEHELRHVIDGLCWIKKHILWNKLI